MRCSTSSSFIFFCKFRVCTVSRKQYLPIKATSSPTGTFKASTTRTSRPLQRGLCKTYKVSDLVSFATGRLSSWAHFLNTLSASLSGPVALPSFKFFRSLSAFCERTGKKLPSALSDLGPKSVYSFSAGLGRVYLAVRVSSISFALASAVRAHVPSCRFSGGMPVLACALCASDADSRHHCLEHLGSFLSLFRVLCTYAWYSSSIPALHSCALCWYSGVPSASCFRFTSFKHLSFIQG